MNEEMHNKGLLLVMEELMSDEFFSLQGTLLIYKIPKEGENISDKVIWQKAEAIKNLIKMGGAVLYNAGKEQNNYVDDEGKSKLNFEFQLLINLISFREIFEQCVKVVSPKLYYQQLKDKLNVPKQTLMMVITTKRIKGKGRELLKKLESFNPVESSALGKNPHKVSWLVWWLNKEKLMRTELSIKSIPGGFYQLTYTLPGSANSLISKPKYQP